MERTFFVVRCHKRDFLKERLLAMDVVTDVPYPIPDHWQDCFRHYRFASSSLPITEQCSKHVLSSPCFPEMTDEEVEKVIDAVKTVNREH